MRAKKLVGFGVAAFMALAGGPAFGHPLCIGAATVDGVLVRQQWPTSREVEVDYVLSGVTEAVDIAVTISDGNRTLAVPDAWGGQLKGDVAAILTGGEKSFRFDPVAVFGSSMPPRLDDLRVSLKAVPTACEGFGDVLYRIVDLEARPMTVTDVTRGDLLSGRYGACETDFGKVGPGFTTPLEDVLVWTGVTNGDLYKTSKLVLRRIPAAGRSFSMSERGIGVSFSKDYWIGVFELTQAQAKLIDPSFDCWYRNPADGATRAAFATYSAARGTKGDYETTSWPHGNHDDIRNESLLGRLNAALDPTLGCAFDLPTEAQWEFAARGGNATALPNGKSGTAANLRELGARISNNGGDDTLPPYGTTDPDCTTAFGNDCVGRAGANAYGLYDVMGNAFEWTLNRAYSGWESDPARGGVDPRGGDSCLPDSTGNYRHVICGGCWAYSFYDVGSRWSTVDWWNLHYLGVRVCCEDFDWLDRDLRGGGSSGGTGSSAATAALDAALLAAETATEAKVKAIATGWDVSNAKPETVLARADRLDATPFDGVGFELRETGDPQEEHTGYLRPSVGRTWSRDSLKKFIPVFREAVTHRSLRHSFITLLFKPVTRLGWTDDAAWAHFAANMATAAWLAKEGGLKGLILDTEDYWKSQQFNLQPGDGLTFDAAAALARQRGAEVFRGVFEAYPDIRILTYWWLSFKLSYLASQDAASAARGGGDLLPAFTEGLLDVMPWTARFLDGNEHTYHWSLTRNALLQRVSQQELISPENRAKFRACTGVSSAFYLDMFVNPPGSAFYHGPAGGRRLNAFLDRYEDAMVSSEEYVWVYGERRSCIAWDASDFTAYAADAYTNGTWDAALPGFSEEFAILRNPRGELIPRLRALKRAGKAVNLAGVPRTTDGGYDYELEVKGARYGEWYAVLVEMKSDHPDAAVGLRKGSSDIWDRPTASVIFSEPDADGLRRGIAFQRIWGEADTLRVTCGYADYVKTKPENLTVAVYRVFAPKEGQ